MNKYVFLLILYSITGGYCDFDIRSIQNLNNKTDVNEEKNESGFTEVIDQNTKKDILFWTSTSEVNSSTSTIFAESEIKDENNKTKNKYIDSKIFEESKTEDSVIEDKKGSIYVNEKFMNLTNDRSQTDLQDYDIMSNEINQEIYLSRNNCYLDLDVDESNTLKVKIKFEPLRNDSFGKCFISLNGRENVMIALLVSHLHLYYNINESSREILKVIVNNSGVNFNIKEYFGKTESDPILLSETHRVYMVLYYNVTTVNATENYSQFNLEVFNYHRNKNIYNMKHEENSHNMYTSSLRHHNINNIFLTTEKYIFSYSKFQEN